MTGGSEDRGRARGVPRLPLLLLRAAAPPDRRDEIAGDLVEGFVRVTEARGVARARIWLWRQVLAADALRLRASDRARRPFGNSSHRTDRIEARMMDRLDGLRREISWAWRSIVRRPGVSAVAIITLATAIGANTAIFTVVNRVLLRPLPYDAPDELAMAFRTVPHFGFERSTASYPDFVDWKEQAASFSDMAAYGYVARVRLAEDGARQWVGYRVTSNLFSLLGVSPAVGRAITADDDRPGAPPVILLSHEVYNTRFGADPGVLEQTVTLDGGPVRIVGVMPEGFGFPSPAATYWEPLRPGPSLERDFNFLTVIGRLAAGHTIETAQTELAQLAARIDSAAPGANDGFGVFVEGRHRFEVRNAERALWIFSGAVFLLLLVACANLANLQLSRTLTRGQEIGVRAALGAGQRRLASQLLAESLVLAAIGGVGGLVLGAVLLRTLVALAPPGLPRLSEVGLDPWMLLFTAGAALAAGVAFGVLPALWGTRQDAADMVREGARSGRSRWTARIQRGFAAAQIAIAISLSIGAGLLVQSFARLTSVDVGFDPAGVLAARLPAPPEREPEMPAGADQMSEEELMSVLMPQIRTMGEARARFFDDVSDRLAGLAGVERVALAYAMPLGEHGFSRTLAPEGSDPTAETPAIDGNVVSPGYFEAMRIPLVSGRTFDETDDAGAPRVTVVNNALAERFWPGESAVGKRLLVGDQRRPVDVVGVVGDVRHNSLDAEAPPIYYSPVKQESWVDAYFLIVRSVLPTADMVSLVRREVAAVDPTLPLTNIATSAALIDASVAAPRFRTLIIATFGAAALLLSIVGVYGVISYAVTERTREMGIRMALGAGTGTILGMVLRGGMRLAAVGILAGVAGALVLTRFMEALLFGVGARDLGTFVVTGVAVLVITAFACYLPARRAARVDPLESLRYE